MNIKVLIADDQAVVRRGFRTMLESPEDIEVVGEAEDGASVIALVQRRAVDVVLMDIRMPGVDGIQATRTLTSREPPVHVIAVTTYDLDDYLFEALRAGASGFLAKTSSPAELVEAIRRVHAGDAVVTPKATRRLVERFVELSPPHPYVDLSSLTPREHEVFVLVARGFSNAEIASSLQIEQSTVKRHVSSLLTKLGLRSRAQMIVFAFRIGLVTAGDL